MIGTVRMCGYGAAVYLVFMLAFPEWKPSPYHIASALLIAGAAFALNLALDAIRIPTLIGTLLFDAAFAAGVAFYLAWTMPQLSGKAPVLLWAEGHRPTRKQARRGVERLGLDPDGGAGRLVVALFPKR